MNALAVTGRGAFPAVIEIADPAPGPGEVLVGVEAASLNGIDVAVAGGYLWDRMPHTFPVVLGRDFAGVVRAITPGVEVPVGTRVAGVSTRLELGPGPIGELFTTSAADIAVVPDGVTSAQAAAVGLAGITAFDLVTAADVSAADTVLVSGATGGVGAFAVQLAAARGATVIATARPGAGEEFVRRLGAAHVVDYGGDLATAARAVATSGVTAILHAAGDPAQLAGLLTRGGRFASALGVTGDQLGRDDLAVTAVMGAYTPEKLGSLLADVAAGKLVAPIASVYPLDDAAAALTAFGSGKLGKIVVTA